MNVKALEDAEAFKKGLTDALMLGSLTRHQIKSMFDKTNPQLNHCVVWLRTRGYIKSDNKLSCPIENRMMLAYTYVKSYEPVDYTAKRERIKMRSNVTPRQLRPHSLPSNDVTANWIEQVAPNVRRVYGSRRPTADLPRLKHKPILSGVHSSMSMFDGA